MASRKGKRPGTSNNIEHQLQNMLMTFRVSELQMLLGFVGQNKTGRKDELQARALEMIRGKSHLNPQIASKIRELYKSIQTGGSGVVQGGSMELASHSSHSGHAMSSQLMPVSRTMANPLPNFHPLAARTSLYPANLYPQAYSQATKGPPALPPGAMMQQQLPINPDVTLKRIPFYEVEGELLRLTTLIHNPARGDPVATFHFYLSPSQADAVSFNREVCPGKSEYLYQGHQREIQLRFCVCETSCEQEDAFPPGLVVKVNGKMCPLPQGPVPINKPATESKRPPRPVNISALCKLCPSVSNALHLTWTPDYSRGGTYVVGLWVVKRLTALDLLEKLRVKGARNADSTANIIREKLSEDGDCDIATTSLRVSLTCPLGKMKMVTPVRPLTCTHLQCFDATIFLQMNEKKPTWSCPVCNKPALYDNLVIDGYFMDVLSSPRLSSDCTEIQLNKDGSWSSHNPTASKRSSETPRANESVQEINDLDSTNYLVEYGGYISSEDELEATADQRTPSGASQIMRPNRGSRDSTKYHIEYAGYISSDDELETTAEQGTPSGASQIMRPNGGSRDSDDDSLDTGIGSSEGGAAVSKTEDGEKSIKGGGSNKVILVDLTCSDSEDDDAPQAAPPPPAKSVSPKTLQPVAAKPSSTSDGSSNGSAHRSSPTIIMLDSPSPPPRQPSPPLLPEPSPHVVPAAAPSPNDARSPYLPPQLSPVPQLATPPSTAPPPLLTHQPSVLPPHTYHPQVHQPEHQPYTNYMQPPYDSRYHPY